MKRRLARWFPHPLMTLALWLVWLMLQQQLTPITFVFGLVLASILPHVWQRLGPAPTRLRHPTRLLLLAVRVFRDVLASNYAVAKLIVFRQPHQPDFVDIQLELDQPTGLAMLACIITATPGTIWVSHDALHRRLLIHVLDSSAKDQLISNIKLRYEPILREVFR